MRGTVYPLEALLDADGTSPNPESNAVEAIAAADIIIAVDRQTDRRMFVFGARLYRQMRLTGRPAAAGFLYVGVRGGTDELLRLCLLVEQVKGGHPHRGPRS